VRPREVIAIVAGTRTKSGSTNFMRLHVMGDSRMEGARFQMARDQDFKSLIPSNSYVLLQQTNV